MDVVVSSTDLSFRTNAMVARRLYPMMLTLEATLHAMECETDDCGFVGCEDMKEKLRHVSHCMLERTACNHRSWIMYTLKTHWEACQTCRYCVFFKTQMNARRNSNKAKINLDNYKHFKSLGDSEMEDEEDIQTSSSDDDDDEVKDSDDADNVNDDSLRSNDGEDNSRDNDGDDEHEDHDESNDHGDGDDTITSFVYSCTESYDDDDDDDEDEEDEIPTSTRENDKVRMNDSHEHDDVDDGGNDNGGDHENDVEQNANVHFLDVE